MDPLSESTYLVLLSLYHTTLHGYGIIKSIEEISDGAYTVYERHKLVTYPRTDSNYLTDDMVDTLKDRLQAIMATTLKDIAKGQMSQSFSAKQRFVNNSKVSDHHAIIPTEVRPDMNQLSQRESKIYMIIAQRYLENLMPPHEYEAVSIELSVEIGRAHV